ncbi:MAG TPA: hypothetical protein VGB18_09435 [Candidatus Thermoplasmatota archaeon]
MNEKAYIEYDDPFEALQAASALASQGRLRFQVGRFGQQHIRERALASHKDPSLSPKEIVAILEAGRQCSHERGDRAFFRTESQIQAEDWEGIGRILFRVEGHAPRGPPTGVVVITAFRVHGWRSS